MRIMSSNVSPILTDIHAKLNNKQENLNGICENIENLTSNDKLPYFQRNLYAKYMTLPDIKNKQTIHHLDDGGGILYIEAEKYLSLSKSTKGTKATEGI